MYDNIIGCQIKQDTVFQAFRLDSVDQILNSLGCYISVPVCLEALLALVHVPVFVCSVFVELLNRQHPFTEIAPLLY